MSFSHNVRECIRSNINDHDRRFACLYGMLLFGRTVTREEIVLKSESEVFDSVFPVLMKTVFGAAVPLQIETKPRKSGDILHIYRIRGEEHVTTIRHRGGRGRIQGRAPHGAQPPVLPGGLCAGVLFGGRLRHRPRPGISPGIYRPDRGALQ